MEEKAAVESHAAEHGVAGAVGKCAVELKNVKKTYRTGPIEAPALRGVVSVVNANGSTVHRVHIERDKILSEQVSFQMVSMLQDVVLRSAD